ncbi:MAG: UDP-glucose/GDP-mannose dehydrogenase family protein [Gammaproteobacteria bacterium]
MNISIIGSGYVGLVSGACLAEVGNSVVCVDNHAEKIRHLRAGRVPLFEPGLEQLVRDNAARGRLHFTTDMARGIAHGEVIFIAVGTPPLDDGAADLRHVTAVARAIGEGLADTPAAGKRVIATKSTVPAGTAEKVRAVIAETLAARGVTARFSVVSNPEFLKQGAAVEDFMKPDRIIIGARESDRDAVDIMRSLYAPFNRNHDRFLAMDTASAELTKYAANVMLAARISCMNEIANLAERLGADIESVRAGVGADPRIGYAFLYSGCGYGGSCFPKDVRALRRAARDAGVDAHLLGAVETVNTAQQYKPVEKAQAHFGDLRGKRFALWGLAFKPDTDDMREAPSRVTLQALWKHGASVQAFDPAATARAREIYGERADLALYRDDPYQALAGADALIVLTEWRALRAADPARIKSEMRGNVLIDARNLYEPAAIRAAGLVYYGIGRA